MHVINCRHFNGYKPCGLNNQCDSHCPKKDIIEKRILLIHLGALGAVVRSTALLVEIKKKYKNAHITWLTQKPADQLLRPHHDIDRVLTLDSQDLLQLQALFFDVVLSVDKSLTVGGIHKMLNYHELYGFITDDLTGAIVPATEAAKELWDIGLSNHKKFNVNRKAETQLVAEALQLPYTRAEYNISLTKTEKDEVLKRRNRWAQNQPIVVGLNTGCSGVIPYKKLSVDFQRNLILKMKSLPISIVLLGGPEDHVRNQQIAYGLSVQQSPTQNGLRDGIMSVAACDLVVTGDSLGMHMAIAMQKWVVAWFGPTCAHEIDLYNRGVHVMSKVSCGPCWKRSCHNQPMCYDRVDISELIAAVEKGIHWYKSSFIQPISVTLSSLSPSCRDSNHELPIDV